MKKMIKLPVFLGVTGSACALILGLVNYVTSPIIEQAAKDKANAAYVSMYQDFNVTSNDIEIVDVSDISGCTTKAIIKTDSVKGVAYTCSAKGYGGTISFQVAFANGGYLSYNDLGNTETGSYGGVVISELPNWLKSHTDASGSLLTNSEYTAFVSGKSTTGKAIAKVVDNCRADYLTWYAANNG